MYLDQNSKKRFAKKVRTKENDAYKISTILFADVYSYTQAGKRVHSRFLRGLRRYFPHYKEGDVFSYDTKHVMLRHIRLEYDYLKSLHASCRGLYCQWPLLTSYKNKCE